MRICPHCQTETEADECPHDGYRTVLKAAKPTESELIGTTFQGRYRIEEKLGSGGMGAVYRATQLSVDRPVALKVIHAKLADNLSDVARFQQEARAIAALHHPNIVVRFCFPPVQMQHALFFISFVGTFTRRILAHGAPIVR